MLLDDRPTIRPASRLRTDSGGAGEAVFILSFLKKGLRGDKNHLEQPSNRKHFKGIGD